MPTPGELEDPDGCFTFRLGIKAAWDTIRRRPGLVGLKVEVTSDSLYGAAKGRVCFDPARGPFAPYVLLRARREIEDGIRSRTPLTRSEFRNGMDPDSRPPPWSLSSLDLTTLIPRQRLPDPDEHLDVERLLQRLDRHHPRLAFVLRELYLKDRPVAEVAAALHVTETRISQLRAEALLTARRYL